MMLSLSRAARSPYSVAAAYIPPRILREAETLCERNGGVGALQEVRLRCEGLCSLVIGGRNFKLASRIDAAELGEVFVRLCDRAVFAHRDEICSGFVAIGGGVRVGVCGSARYEGGRMVGVDGICSLVFRIPSGECAFAPRLYSHWRDTGGGMLICSRAGGGKTTAIRALTGEIGRRADRRVVVVDERREFDAAAYLDCTVDILKGYRRHAGIDAAVRTLSAEVLVVDEIGSPEDASAILRAIGSGVAVIATAHGTDVREACRRDYVRLLVERGAFESFVSIGCEGGRFTCSISAVGGVE